MRLLPFKQEYIKLEKEVRKLRGRKFSIPLKIIENPFLQGEAICTIDDVFIYENCLEVTYTDGKEDDIWTTIDFKTVDDFADWLD